MVVQRLLCFHRTDKTNIYGEKYDYIMDDSTEWNENSSQSDNVTAEDYNIPLSKSELKSVLSTIDDAVFIFSVEHTEDGISFTFEWNNPRHESITGMTIDEFGGLQPNEFLGEEQGAEVVNNYRKCVDQQATIEYTETLEHEQDEIVWHTKIIPVIEGDDVIQIIGMARNITDLVNRTKHLQVVDRVLRHNIRNTLNLIRGQAREIGAEADSPIGEKTNQIIESSNDLLRTTQKARAITEIILEEPPVTTLGIDSLLDQVKTKLSETNYQALISVTGSHSGTMVASPQLSDAVVELLENAADHHDKPDPTIELILTVDEETIILDVVDDGPGIPESERDILVNGKPPGDLSHGSGIGMWMVYWIVNHSYGEIMVSDRKPRGSVVTLRLPRPIEDR